MSQKFSSNDPDWNNYYHNWYYHNYGGAYLDLAAGVALKLDKITLRGQAGIHGLYLGVGFQL